LIKPPSIQPLPFEFSREHLLLPLNPDRASGDPMRCLSAGVHADAALDNLSLFLDAPLELIPTPEPELRDAITRTYQEQMAHSDALRQSSPSNTPEPDRLTVQEALHSLTDRDLLASGDKAPVAKLVDALLFDALTKQASDLHVHPYPDKLIIRYRIDGVLHNVYTPDPKLYDQIVGRIKVLAGMDVAEKRLPQDGRTSVTVGGQGGRQIDLRVSTLPTTCGERVVIRLLEQTAKLKALSELGMPAEIEHSFKEAIHRSHGLILVTGPTGSGKTTTLYSALAQLDSTRKNILTLEDPVEYQLEGISQTQVATKKGMTFVSALRHVLRQDPDVILVGEVRDEPTARMVIQSSMTGHLVLTTLHTNNSAGAVARLADLGIEPYLITSSLIGVLAQRLVRKCCSACQGATASQSDEFCSTCGNTGYSGRVGLYEWLPVTPEIRDQILTSANADKLESLAISQGMKTLWSQGRALVTAGVTTDAELHRVLGSTTGGE